MRNRIRKTQPFCHEDMQSAVKAVITDDMKIRPAAIRYRVDHVTLSRYVKKQRALGKNQEIIHCKPHYQTRLVFTKDQESILAEYLKTCAKMYYGKTTRNTRELAYEMATLNGIRVPESWHKNKSAGLDWMRGFFKRNGTLSIRQPENCSLSRMTSFTRPNVELFFHNLEEVLNRFGDQLNLDETATSTVPSKSVKVIAHKGARTVSNSASAERGILVTTTKKVVKQSPTLSYHKFGPFNRIGLENSPRKEITSEVSTENSTRHRTYQARNREVRVNSDDRDKDTRQQVATITQAAGDE
ncbi:uncharacterized protein LOC123319163 [Coccinella septempunctata]|uniref:uncharacterized protein LOC123319163 n=1 Tax=Coccinella septempunctata TaxID=41139 RepID=UPI001D079B09|nr:uncharacterized protein LOC123319163 [Coccinella septempunctata]